MCEWWWFFKQVPLPSYPAEPIVLTGKQGLDTGCEELLPGPGAARPAHVLPHTPKGAPRLPEPALPDGALTTSRRLFLPNKEEVDSLAQVLSQLYPTTSWLLSQRRTSFNDLPRCLGESPSVLRAFCPAQHSRKQDE